MFHFWFLTFCKLEFLKKNNFAKNFCIKSCCIHEDTAKSSFLQERNFSKERV